MKQVISVKEGLILVFGALLIVGGFLFTYLRPNVAQAQSACSADLVQQDQEDGVYVAGCSGLF